MSSDKKGTPFHIFIYNASPGDYMDRAVEAVVLELDAGDFDKDADTQAERHKVLMRPEENSISVAQVKLRTVLAKHMRGSWKRALKGTHRDNIPEFASFRTAEVQWCGLKALASSAYRTVPGLDLLGLSDHELLLQLRMLHNRNDDVVGICAMGWDKNTSLPTKEKKKESTVPTPSSADKRTPERVTPAGLSANGKKKGSTRC
ncbi:hypothetical protein Micbo1qcDRAFT_177161 [Microdochium bolleyi]|uniref:Uncharacterized protein n=1 Tax=Microdochium bolleyi TaxID=196109 RepID=A0A136IWR0_9PEZI|nr:hypothetical protein Micbo1qcDRAFT_177161 [Microdochium bolleyi]